MSSEFNENNYSSKMDKSIQSLKKDLSTLRTGRANPNMLDTIKIDVYGQLMPIEQLGTISVPEARLISIQVWDKANITLIDSAIQKSELGINPQIDGQIIRLRIPDLTEERRKDLIKVLKNMGEKGKNEELGIKIAMHIAASNPLAINKDGIKKEIIDKELEIIKAEITNSGKPAEMAEKISKGKISKFINDNTLLNQIWIMDPKKKVSDILKENKVDKEIKILDFIRYKVGEGV